MLIMQDFLYLSSAVHLVYGALQPMTVLSPVQEHNLLTTHMHYIFVETVITHVMGVGIQRIQVANYAHH